MEDANPKAFGRFTLLSVLGQGGMGCVYRAAIAGPSGFRKELALKVLRADTSANREAHAASLAKEARIGALLRHPNLVDLYDHGVHEGQPWFSMELVEGRTLHEVIAREGPLAPARAAHILAQIALGLAAIHELQVDGQPGGLVHRDLKPLNVLVTRDDHVKIADFGISRGQHELLATQSDALQGTPAYMSPEHAKEEELTAQSDLFALGLIGWEVLTGQRFLRGDSIFEVMFNLLQVEGRLDDVRGLDGELPGLGTLLAECLREDPRSRPASARSVRGRLLALELRQTGPAPPAWTDTTLHAPTVEPEEDELTQPAGNLLRPLDVFIGRERELGVLRASLDTPGRVVSLLGAGGTGKTRLAQQLGLGLLSQFPSGVWLVDLTETRSLDDVCAATASVFNIPLTQGADEPAQRIATALAMRGRMLVLVDNFEQVARHAGATVGAWAQSCPDVRFVVTTRQRLGLRNEHVVRLGPLGSHWTPDQGMDALAQVPAVRLFEERARMQRPGFLVNEDNAADIAQLVRALDGIPLAIELAAARIRVLSPARLLERLPQRFELLSTGRTDVTGRQATLRATIEWSWALLEPWEQAGLAASAVFRGGFSADAAEAVLDLSSWPDAPWVLDVLEALDDKSLLRAVEDASGEVRFVHFESIREFALGKLREGGDEEAVDLRHLRWFSDFGRPEPLNSLFTHGSTARRQRLRADLQNLAQAADRGRELGDPESACRATLALVEVMYDTGPLGELSQRLDASLADTLPTGLRALTLIARGRVRGLQAQNDEAEADLRAAAAATEDADPVLAARAWTELGRLRAYSSECGQTELLERALAVFREHGEPLLEGRALCGLAIRDAVAGEFQRARSRNESALQLVKRSGDRHSELVALGNLAVAYKELAMGVLELATLNEALRLARELGARRQEAVLLLNLGVHQQLEGRLGQAEGLYRDALQRCRETGFLDLEEGALANIGDVLKDRGLLHRAEGALRESLRCSDRGGHVRFRPAILGMLGQVLVELDRLDEAEPVLAEARAFGLELGNPRHSGEVAIWTAAWHRRRGDHPAARESLNEADDLMGELPEQRFFLRARIERCELLLAEGDPAGARTLADEIEGEVHAVQDPLLLGLLLEVRGRAERSAGDPEAVQRTARQLGQALDGLDLAPASPLRRGLKALLATD